MAVTVSKARGVLRRVAVAAIVASASFAVTGITAPPAHAASCSDCGESDLDLHFYNAAGNTSPQFVYGQPVTLSAMVTDVSDSCGNGDCDPPSGKVVFSENNVTLAISPEDPNDYTGDEFDHLLTTFDTVVSNLSVGAHVIKAHYHSPNLSTANPHHFDDSEDTQTLVIVKAGAAATLSTNKSPAAFGSTVTFTANVTPNPAVAANAAKPTGDVSLVDTTEGGNRFVTKSTLNNAGQATFNVSDLPVGARTLQAVYLGDANYELAKSSNIDQTITKASSFTSVSTSPNPSTFGKTTTFTATVTPNTATGTVAFSIDGVAAGSATLSAGKASVTSSSMTAGSHTIVAEYGGNNNFTSSFNFASHTVQKVNTTGTMKSTPNPSVYGQSVGLSGSVSPATATGNVTFYDGTTAIGTSTAPSATGSTSALSVGSHALKFVYDGDANHNGSTSNTVTHVVNKANTATALSPTSATGDFGSTAPLNVSVGAVAPGAGTPTGTVTLREGSTVVASTTLSAAKGSFTIPELLPGSHSFVATYSGDGNFNASTSNASTFTVTCQRTVTSSPRGGMTIGSGSTCIMGSGATIDGTLWIGSGARVYIGNAAVRGAIYSSGASRLAICGSTVGSRMEIHNTRGPVVIGDTTNSRCAGNQLEYLTVDTTSGPVTVSDNTGTFFTISSNTAPAGTQHVIAANKPQYSLRCFSNTPAPVNNGRPNTSSSKAGQCLSL